MLRAALARVSIPVLMLQSSYVDEAFVRCSLRAGMGTPWTELVKIRVPSTELRIIEGVGHFPQLEAATAVTESIERFVRRLMPD
jgi:pimeloyl-ACP methyl ester carboxylesterase